MQIETLLHSHSTQKLYNEQFIVRIKLKYTPATLFYAKTNVQIILTSFDFYNLFHVTFTQQ